MGEIIECLDGPIEIADCTHSDDPHSSCIGPENCLAVLFWDDFKSMINDKLYGTSLAELLVATKKGTKPGKQKAKMEA